MPEILIVDDDENICAALQQFIRDLGHLPFIASNGGDAISVVAEHHPDVVIMDIRMPGMDGLEALPAIRASDPDVPVLMMTAYGTSQTSIDAASLGAFEYINKPLDLDVLGPLIQKALEARASEREARATADPDFEKYERVELVGDSAAMLTVYKRIGLLTGKDVAVLLTGEKGVGKKLVARTIHANSPQADGPFVVASCRSPNAEHVAGEIFGPVAHAGEADSGSPGKLALAQGGTLLLEDVDALPLSAQASILELFADSAAGGAPRLLASTSKDLPTLVAEGSFNEELYDLLRVVTIELPPLRSRVGDIPELVRFFISRCNVEFDMTIRGVNPRVKEQLRGHSWPGNVRQLQNVIKSACLLARGDVIAPDDLGDGLTERGSSSNEEVKAGFKRAVRDALELRLNAEGDGDRRAPFHEVVAQVEAILIQEALERTGGNQLKAAGLLELNRTTLRKKIQIYGI